MVPAVEALVDRGVLVGTRVKTEEDGRFVSAGYRIPLCVNRLAQGVQTASGFFSVTYSLI